MRIIHIITKLHEMYGAQRHAVESMKNHLQNNHECLAIAGTDGYATEAIKALGINVITVPTLKNTYNLLVDFKAVAAIVAIIEEYKPDLVISHSSKAGFIARIACYKTKTPNIFTVHGWPFENGTPIFQKLAALAVERMMIPFSDSYVCVSDYTKQFGLAKLPFDKTRVYACPNIHEKKEEPFSFDNILKRNVLMVGGFRAQKDHITALKALKIIIKENKLPTIHFTFVGDGPNRGNIEKFIEKNNLGEYITLAGETKDIDSFYDNSDIVILPTYYEGLPLSLIEAIQKGKPIIATDTGGINEIVQNGVNGNLIAVEDAFALANHLSEYYLNNKIPQLSINARKIYDTHYSYDIINEKLNNMIESVVQNSIFNISKSSKSNYPIQPQ